MQYDSLVRTYLQGLITQRTEQVLSPLRSFSRKMNYLFAEAGGRESTLQATLESFEVAQADPPVLSDVTQVSDYGSAVDDNVLIYDETDGTFNAGTLTRSTISEVRRRRLLTDLLLDAIEGDDILTTILTYATAHASTRNWISSFSSGSRILTSTAILERFPASTTSFSYTQRLVFDSTYEIRINEYLKEARAVQALMIVDPNGESYSYGSAGLGVDVIIGNLSSSPPWVAMNVAKVGETAEGLDIVYGRREITPNPTTSTGYYRIIWRPPSTAGVVPHFQIHGSAIRIER